MRIKFLSALILSLLLFFSACDSGNGLDTDSLLTAEFLDELEASLSGRIESSAGTVSESGLTGPIPGFTAADVARILTAAEQTAEDRSGGEDEPPAASYLCIYQSAAETLCLLLEERQDFPIEPAIGALFYAMYSSCIPRLPVVAALFAELEGRSVLARTDFGMEVNHGLGIGEPYVLNGLIDYSKKEDSHGLSSVRLGAGQMALAAMDCFAPIPIPQARLAVLQSEMSFGPLNPELIPPEPPEPNDDSSQVEPASEPISNQDIARARLAGLLDALAGTTESPALISRTMFESAARQIYGDSTPSASELEELIYALLTMAIEELEDRQTTDGSWENYHQAAILLTRGVLAIADMADETDWVEVYAYLPKNIAIVISLIEDSGTNKYYEFVSGLMDSLKEYGEIHPAEDPEDTSLADSLIESCAGEISTRLLEADSMDGPWDRTATFLVALDNYMDSSIEISIDSAQGPKDREDLGISDLQWIDLLFQ